MAKSKTVHVRFRSGCYITPTDIAVKGEVRELPRALAGYLIGQGRAELVDEDATTIPPARTTKERATRRKLTSTFWELGTSFPGDTRGPGSGPGDGIVNGYPALVTNQLSSVLTKGTGTGLCELIFGNFDDLLIVLAAWGPCE